MHCTLFKVKFFNMLQKNKIKLFKLRATVQLKDLGASRVRGIRGSVLRYKGCRY